MWSEGTGTGRPILARARFILVVDLMSLISRLARFMPSIALSSASPSEPNTFGCLGVGRGLGLRASVRYPHPTDRYGPQGLRVGQHAGPAVPVAASGIRNTRLRLVDGEHHPPPEQVAGATPPPRAAATTCKEPPERVEAGELGAVPPPAEQAAEPSPA